ncbi:MAG: hypothetical protein NTZ79_17235 [Proteobacteria bacterium]|nr:hypothetical protein [Pseudomonadota bacterium]
MTTMVLNRFRKPSAWRMALTALLLLATGFQSYVAQTHIHLRAQQTVAQLGAASHSSDRPTNAPRENPGSCFLCQIGLHGGVPIANSFRIGLAPAGKEFLLASVNRLIAPLAVVSYNWQGRGPPST